MRARDRLTPLPRARRVVVFLLLAAGAWVVSGVSSWWQWRQGTEVRVFIRGATGDDLAEVVSAVRLFSDSGLDVPPTEIVLHPPAACPISGVAAGQAHRGRARHLIVVCTTRERVLVHELAHAWTFEHLGPRDMAAFALVRELPTWQDRGFSWEERAMEHAAEVITWAVLGLEPDEVLVAPRDPQSLQFAYGYLRGAARPDVARHTARSVTRFLIGAITRLSPDPCRSVTEPRFGLLSRTIGDAASIATDAGGGVCWIPTATGDGEPVAVIEVPSAER